MNRCRWTEPVSALYSLGSNYLTSDFGPRYREIKQPHLNNLHSQGVNAARGRRRRRRDVTTDESVNIEGLGVCICCLGWRMVISSGRSRVAKCRRLCDVIVTPMMEQSNSKYDKTGFRIRQFRCATPYSTVTVNNFTVSPE